MSSTNFPSGVSVAANCKTAREQALYDHPESKMVAMTITQAESAWRAAYRAMDSATDDSEFVRLARAEQDAWDAYTELCNDVDQCYEPGCRETVPEYCYCPRHRP